MSVTHEQLANLGFYFGTSGAHAGRSLMLEDLATLLATMPHPVTRSICRAAIVDDNLLAKSTLNNRVYAAKRMGQLYGLDDSICLFRNFRRLWDGDHISRPSLAVLLALARDGLFMASATIVLPRPIGAIVLKSEIAKQLDAHTAGRMSEETLKHAAANTYNSWSQAGYLTESLPRVRTRATAVGPGAATFALFLAWLEGVRGENLFRTRWVAALDRSFADCVELTSAAAKRGMLDFLNAGGVMELRFPGYLTAEEQALA